MPGSGVEGEIVLGSEAGGEILPGSEAGGEILPGSEARGEILPGSEAGGETVCRAVNQHRGFRVANHPSSLSQSERRR